MRNGGSSSLFTNLVTIIILVACFTTNLSGAQTGQLPQEEKDALKEIGEQLGKRDWNFNLNPCDGNQNWSTTAVPVGKPAKYSNTIQCHCNYTAGVCHIHAIILKGQNLDGILPPSLVKLPYIKMIILKRQNLDGILPPSLVKLPYIKIIDLAYNYLRGTIPREWASSKLEYLSVIVNRLSGTIPDYLGNLTRLTFGSNLLTGMLPLSLAGLTNLTDFRISDNNFTGQIPQFIQNLKQLTRLDIGATGMKGPIPAGISSLDNLTSLTITDIAVATQSFPNLSNSTDNLKLLVLRNCNISGEIPTYIWGMTALKQLDLSFNKLVGQISKDITGKALKFVFLTGNMLSGDIPESILMDGRSVDLSYNNFTWQGPEQPTCQEDMNLDINLFKSSSSGNTLKGILPCSNATDLICPKYGCSLHVNSGGNDLKIPDGNEIVMYDGDAEVSGGAATYYKSPSNHWGLSSTGDFKDDNNDQNKIFAVKLQSPNIPDMYTTARISPLSLTYFGYCLENGSYDVRLYFAEIQFVINDTITNSLGKRIFDIYIQEKIVQKDFNIVEDAQGAQKPLVKHFNASVTNNILEVRLTWSGKGTTRIPKSGVYGPLISAISVNSNFKACTTGGKKNKTGGKKNKNIFYITIGVVAFFIIT